MQHKRDFEELFKEKYQGIITRTNIDKGAKMRLKVLAEEKRQVQHYFKRMH